MVLALLGYLHFSINFRISLATLQSILLYIDWSYIDSIDQLLDNSLFNFLNLLIYEHGIYIFIY